MRDNQGVKTAALLHDIGKAVPEHILSKPDR
jgi:response regulator RpfG family c-di-GMP phosphodiesterase